MIERFSEEKELIVLERKSLELSPVLAVLDSYLEMLRWFAGTQIRNTASVGGNLAWASPISDLNPLHMALGATVETSDGRRLKVDDEFFCGYRKTGLREKELIVNVEIPVPIGNTHSHSSNFDSEAAAAEGNSKFDAEAAEGNSFFFRSYKQTRRKDDDISIVNAAFRLEFDTEQ